MSSPMDQTATSRWTKFSTFGLAAISRLPNVYFLLAAVVVTIVTATCVWLSGRADTRWPWLLDLDIYRVAARAVVQGRDPYLENLHGFGYLYPPVTAWLFVPIAFMGLGAAGFIWTLVNVVSMMSVLWFTLGFMKVNRGPRLLLVLILTPISFYFGPTAANEFYGQINVILLMLIFIDFYVLRNTKWHGALIGLVVGVKLFLGIFIFYLLVTKRYRAMLIASGSFGAAMTAGFIVDPTIALKYWTKILPNGQELMGTSYSVGSTSFRSVIERAVAENAVVATILWTIVAGAFAVIAMWVAYHFTRRGDTLLAVSICGIIAAVCPPITWPHYWVWVIPGILALCRYAVLLRSIPVALAVVVSIAALQVPSAAMPNLYPLTLSQQARLGVPEQFEAASYQITALLLLAAAVVCVRTIDSCHPQRLATDSAPHARS